MATPSDAPQPLPNNPILQPDSRPNVSAQLARLKFEKQNKDLPRLPTNVRVERRPLLHPTIPAPQVGRHAQKCVYVSRKTPIMSAVKRVRKLLYHVEKRAMQDIDVGADRVNGMKKLTEANDRLAKDGEKVYVKASGRAMEQALRIAEWFRRHEDEVGCRVEVSTGSVQAIDDLVEKSDDDETSGVALEAEGEAHDDTFSTAEDMDTSLMSNISDVIPQKMTGEYEQQAAQERGEEPKPKRRTKRKRPQYTEEDLPEARIRWIKTIEVAVSLKA